MHTELPTDDLRLLVFGGRDYRLKHRVFDEILQVLDGVPMHKITIMHGACNCEEGDPPLGADYFAHLFCGLYRGFGLREQPFPAKWRDISVPRALIRYRLDGQPYNAFAGHTRNQQMLDEGRPTHALGFPGGKGTADMHRRITRAIAEGTRIDLRVIE